LSLLVGQGGLKFLDQTVTNRYGIHLNCLWQKQA